MKTGTKILLGAGAVLVVGGYAYRKGVDNITFAIDGFQLAPDGVNILVRIKVVNHNRFFGYPVPRMEVNVYDQTGNYIGSMVNQQLQYIPANDMSFIYAVAIPNYASLTNLIMSIITSGSLPSGITFKGWIQAGPVEIPFDTGIGITGPVMAGKLKDLLHLGVSWLE